MTILRTVAACAGVITAYALMELGGACDVLGLVLLVVSVGAVESA